MNQSKLTISCVFLASALSTLGTNWQSNKARDSEESRAVITLSSKFAGVEASVDKFGVQMNTLIIGQVELQTQVKALEEFKKDASGRLRELERKVR